MGEYEPCHGEDHHHRQYLAESFRHFIACDTSTSWKRNSSTNTVNDKARDLRPGPCFDCFMLNLRFSDVALGVAEVHLVRQEDRFRDLFHRFARVHTGPANPVKGFRLFETVDFH